jgi:hypothetical protein
MKDINSLVNELFICKPDLEIYFDQWIHSRFKPSLSLGMKIDDLIRINESEILRWLTNKIMEFS